MVLLLLGLLLLAMAAHSSASYCICKPVSDVLLQGAIDFACGAGADCNAIKPTGQCYNPNSVRNHCSYAVNSYYQKKAAYGATCDFGGAAGLTNNDPSGGGCSFSATSSTGAGVGTGTTSPVTTVPSTTPTMNPVTPVSGTGGTGVGTGAGTGIGTGMPTGTTPTGGTTTSPYSTTPIGGTPGVLGGVGMAPTGSSLDDNHAGIKLESTTLGSALLALVVSGIHLVVMSY